MPEKIEIARIRRDGGTQSRQSLNGPTVYEYAEEMKGGAVFPPVILYYDGTEYVLADGFHRVAAAELAGLTVIAADVRQGSRRDAVLHSVGANATHGLRRTNQDKRRAVETLLRDDEWRHWSDREIARRCGVHHTTVSSIRGQVAPAVSGEIRQMRTVERNGTTYQQQVKAAPAPVVPAVPTPAPATPRFRAGEYVLTRTGRIGRISADTTDRMAHVDTGDESMPVPHYVESLRRVSLCHPYHLRQEVVVTGSDVTGTITGLAGNGGALVNVTRPNPNGGRMTQRMDWTRLSPVPAAVSGEIRQMAAPPPVVPVPAASPYQRPPAPAAPALADLMDDVLYKTLVALAQYEQGGTDGGVYLYDDLARVRRWLDQIEQAARRDMVAR